MTDDLIAFLRARLDEEAECAHSAGGTEWSLQEHEGDTVLIYDSHGEPVVYDEGWPTPAQALHIVGHDPARVLAEIEAKRRILHEHRQELAGWCETCDVPGDAKGSEAGCPTVRLLALRYSGHPDYRQEWRP